MSLEQLRISGRLPSPKGVALAVMELCRSDDTTLEDLADVVQRDPALCGRLLRLANSAAMGVRPVAAVSEAVLRLGLRAVRNLATGFSLVDEYSDGACKRFDYQRFWSHSLLMAVAMRELGVRTRVAVPDELFACGLMARIGRLALATAYPAEYGEVLSKEVGSDSELVERERNALSLDHNECTREILTSFGLPQALVEPVVYHETPEDSGFSEGSRPHLLTHLFYFGRRMADLGCGSESLRSETIAELLRLAGRIGLDADDFGSMVDGILQRWREWGELLKVQAGELPSFSDMAQAPAPREEDASAGYPPLKVLLVEDEAVTRQMLIGALERIGGYQVCSASNGQEALALAVEAMPHIVITDWRMPVMDGIHFCRALRDTQWGQSMYVIMLTAVDAEEEVVLAFEAGVDDYVTKPVNRRSLHARMRAAQHYVRLLQTWERDREQLKRTAAELALSNRKLEHFAHTDMLTGLPNRRAAMDSLEQAWNGAERSGEALVVMMLDIDAFKGFNDTYGHAVGDRMLTEVGRVLRDASRKDDRVCRFGGEEFIVVCRNTNMQAAREFAERLRVVVAGLRLLHGDEHVQTTVSIGLAGKEPEMGSVELMVNAADKALYAAKNGGRNRICYYDRGRVRAVGQG